MRRTGRGKVKLDAALDAGKIGAASAMCEPRSFRRCWHLKRSGLPRRSDPGG